MRKLIIIIFILFSFVVKSQMLFTSYYSGGVADTSFVPTDIDSCKLWLKADAGITKDGSNYVSKWEDQSGNGFDVAQSTGSKQPLWVANDKNGKPGISFDGGDCLFRVQSLTNQAEKFTIYSVWHTSTGQNARYPYNNMATSGSAANGFDIYISSTPALRNVVKSDISSKDIAYNHTINSDTVWIVRQEVNFSLAGNELKTYINGIMVAQGNCNGTNIATTAEFGVGGWNIAVNTYNFIGRINEIVAYKDVVSEANDVKIVNYLRTKYGY